MKPAAATISSTSLTLNPLPEDELGQLHRYWTGLGGGQALPPIGAVKPEHLAFLLGRINLVEVHDQPRRYRFRLVGSMIAHVAGQELHARTSAEIRPAVYRRTVEAHYADAFFARAPSLHEIVLSNGQVTRRYRRIILPFVDKPPVAGVLMTGTVFQDRLRDVLDSEAFRRD